MERSGDSGGSEDGDRSGAECLGVKLGDPPVVFAGRVGGDIGEGFGVGRPVEFINVEVGGRDHLRRRGLRDIHTCKGDALDFNAVFADDAGGELHGCECAGGASGAIDVEKGNAGAIGREGGLFNIAIQGGQALGGFAVEVREVEVLLLTGPGAVGEESEGFGVGGPG